MELDTWQELAHAAPSALRCSLCYQADFLLPLPTCTVSQPCMSIRLSDTTTNRNNSHPCMLFLTALITAAFAKAHQPRLHWQRSNAWPFIHRVVLYEDSDLVEQHICLWHLKRQGVRSRTVVKGDVPVIQQYRLGALGAVHQEGATTLHRQGHKLLSGSASAYTAHESSETVSGWGGSICHKQETLMPVWVGPVYGPWVAVSSGRHQYW